MGNEPTAIFGSRALNLSKKRRKEIASYMRLTRESRQIVRFVAPEDRASWMNARKINEREILADMLSKGEAEPAPRLMTGNLPDTMPRIERTERERYEDRCAEREAHSQRALADYDRMLMRGPY